MRAEIRHLHTPDIDPDSFVPDDAERFMFLVQLLAGPAGDQGEESFEFIVCTPGWLAEQIGRDGPMTGRHHVIVNRFDWPALVSFFQRLVSRCTGTDWDEVAAKIGRFGHWEFEDYSPTPGESPSGGRS